MYDMVIFWEWLAFGLRWLHVITAIAWIGSSFYFIALDLGLRQKSGLPKGAYGEEWQVHGGGFYHIQKYLVAPENLPDHLTWFKWESYATWLSGFALLCVIYYAGADLYLIDRSVWDVSNLMAIAISLVSIAGAWIFYDLICRSRVGAHSTGLMIILYILLVALAWGYTQLFTGRAALLHLGAATATIMSANVFFIIIPNQKIVVADLKAGRTPDPKYGIMAKQRSTHNNYLTLPVLFFMLSNHMPLAFATEYSWIIASLVFLMGVTIRHYFNTRHARKGNPLWTWGLTAILFGLIIWLSSIPKTSETQEQKVTHIPSKIQQFTHADNFEDIYNIVLGRCSMCHAAEPLWDGITTAPKGIILETEIQIAAHARSIYLQSGISEAMPPANVAFMEPEERRLIRTWYDEATTKTMAAR